MINTYCYDVEILPNFFSITIVNLKSYLSIFEDCNINGKPVPLVEVLKVEEIKSRLDKVEKWQFWISDFDDNQLLDMYAFITNMEARLDENGVAIRTDMFGYNNNKYDKLMVAGFLMYFNNCNSTKELINKLYELSKEIIRIQDLDKSEFYKSYIMNTVSKYNMPYVDIDVMSIFALNKVNKITTANGTKFVPKSLKQTSINLKWYELLEHELPPITEVDVHYYHKDMRYKGISPDNLNNLINKWDRFMIIDWVDNVMHYNTNDVFIVCEMIRMFIEEVKLRYSITKSYGVDVLSSSRSSIADKIFTKFYSEFSGLHPTQWQGRKTERTKLSFKKAIFDKVRFRTKELNEFLDELKRVVIYGLGKKSIRDLAIKDNSFKYIKYDKQSGWFEVTINKLTYTIATGGIHSKDVPNESKSYLTSSTGKLIKDIKEGDIWNELSDDAYVYCHLDVNSYYPSLMSVYEIYPNHMDKNVFVKLISWLKDTRVTAKHSKEEYIDGIHKDVLAQVLKIVINSIYGKLGYEYGDLYDKMAVLKVTINGQLFLLMLCEELEINSIEVISANTDGIVVKLHKRNKQLCDDIVAKWESDTGLSLDGEEYKTYINRDINNYFAQEFNGKVSYKGAFNPLMYRVDLSKGYDAPIVAKAVVDFFLYDKPILETLHECRDILDFCKSQNISRSFKLIQIINNNEFERQRNSRFYVSTSGHKLYKKNGDVKSVLANGKKVEIINTLDDIPIEYRNIDYMYYYNECIKIIDPIKLRISPNQKSDKSTMTKSGKAIIKQNSGMYLNLFTDADFE